MRTAAPGWALVAIAAGSILWPGAVYGKRAAPAAVAPVVWQGVEYRAPLDPQHMGYVQAFDVASGRKLWETRVYSVSIDRGVEEDVQWVFVSGLRVEGGKLWVRNESGKSYRLNLKTGRVEGWPRFWHWWLFGGVGLLLPVAVFVVWIGRRRGRGKPG